MKFRWIPERTWPMDNDEIHSPQTETAYFLLEHSMEESWSLCIRVAVGPQPWCVGFCGPLKIRVTWS